METTFEHITNKEISPQRIGKLLNEFIDILSSPEDGTGGELVHTKQNELKNIYKYLKGKGSISHDLSASLGSFISFNTDFLKNIVQESGSDFFKEKFQNDIRCIEVCYNKNKNIGSLIDHLKFIDNNLINYLSYDNVKNFIKIDDEEFFLLAIAENLYKNAEKFTIDQGSIHISIKDIGNYIMLSSYNLTSHEFNKENKQKILSGEGNIISEEGENHQKGQGIYLSDLTNSLKKIKGGLSIVDTPSIAGGYHINMIVTIPKK